MAARKTPEISAELDEVTTEDAINVDGLIKQDGDLIFVAPDEICTGCKHLVLSMNAVYWPQMCYRNGGNVTNLWANDEKQPLRSAGCMAGGWKDTNKQEKK